MDYICTYCGYETSTIRNWNRHNESNKHKIAIKSILCDICWSRYKKSNTYIHISSFENRFILNVIHSFSNSNKKFVKINYFLYIYMDHDLLP